MSWCDGFFEADAPLYEHGCWPEPHEGELLDNLLGQELCPEALDLIAEEWVDYTDL